MGCGGRAPAASSDNRPMHVIGRWCLLLGIGVALGCAPALNWREARFPSAPVRMLLPCKPDKAAREVEMGGRTLALEMQGCEAHGTTFAVSHVVVPDAHRAPLLLEGWKQAVVSHLGAADVRELAWSPPGGWALPQSVRMQAVVPRAGQAGLSVYAAWFARAEGSGVHLFHAIVLARAPMPEVAETFFSGIVLQ